MENSQIPICTLSGQVIHGKGIGKTAGVPTANLLIEQEQLPPLGVYASVVHIKGSKFLGATNVGLRPGIDSESRISVETFIIDFQGSLYGTFLEVDLYCFLRPAQKMKSLKDLQQQVGKDCLTVRERLCGIFLTNFEGPNIKKALIKSMYASWHPV